MYAPFLIIQFVNLIFSRGLDKKESRSNCAQQQVNEGDTDELPGGLKNGLVQNNNRHQGFADQEQVCLNTFYLLVFFFIFKVF